MTQLIKGSIKVVGAKDIAAAMAKAKLVLICDRSGSMSSLDGYQNKARYEVEDSVVTNIQNKYPGQVVLIAFSDTAKLCLDGILPSPSGNTMMTHGLEKATPLALAGLKCVLISDGEPSEPEDWVLEKVKKDFIGRLHTIFVGPEISEGAQFIRKIAQVARGQYNVYNPTEIPELLENMITYYLTAGD